LRARGLEASRDDVERTVWLIRERATTFVDAADRLDFVLRDPPAMDETAAAKFLVPAHTERLRELAGLVERVDPWTAQAIEQAVEAWVAAAGLQMKDLGQPARVALTGRTASPGLFDVIAVLGRERAARRLRSAAEVAQGK